MVCLLPADLCQMHHGNIAHGDWKHVKSEPQILNLTRSQASLLSLCALLGFDGDCHRPCKPWRRPGGSGRYRPHAAVRSACTTCVRSTCRRYTTQSRPPQGGSSFVCSRVGACPHICVTCSRCPTSIRPPKGGSCGADIRPGPPPPSHHACSIVEVAAWAIAGSTPLHCL